MNAPFSIGNNVSNITIVNCVSISIWVHEIKRCVSCRQRVKKKRKISNMEKVRVWCASSLDPESVGLGYLESDQDSSC